MAGLQEKGESISLTPHYHFHPLHRHSDISRTIIAEGSPLHWQPDSKREPLVCESKSLTTKLRALKSFFSKAFITMHPVMWYNRQVYELHSRYLTHGTYISIYVRYYSKKFLCFAHFLESQTNFPWVSVDNHLIFCKLLSLVLANSYCKFWDFLYSSSISKFLFLVFLITIIPREFPFTLFNKMILYFIPLSTNPKKC